MNKLQKTIISLYLIAIAIGCIVLIFPGDGGITIIFTIIIGTPLTLLLTYLWKNNE